MTTNYVFSGETLNYTNSGVTTINSGAVVVVGNLVGVALTTILVGGTGAVATSGAFTLPKVAGSAWVQGAKLLWDASAAKFDIGTATPATGDVSNCCVAAEAATSAATTGVVLLTGSVGTVA
jgi:predicted RecA/RadA family phage recombinase